MSKIFSCVEAYDDKGRQSVDFRVAGWVRDEDDFFDCDDMDEFYEDAEGDLEVVVNVYSFGEGESESASDDEMRMLTEEFIDNECDCIEVINFVIIKEEDND